MSKKLQTPGLPKKQQELIQKIHNLLQERGYTFYDAQMVTGLVMAANKAEDPIKALDTASSIHQLMTDGKIEKPFVQPLLEILAIKVNEHINKTQMSDIKIEQF